ncbi:hypothetical protein B484DRAFT_441567 [Ochromonadaceae sp. CCMP2298]|nr:hypothetical protein B484DRAFT_441567 [Ochromonadaceae sp. CCMP2298]
MVRVGCCGWDGVVWGRDGCLGCDPAVGLIGMCGIDGCFLIGMWIGGVLIGMCGIEGGCLMGICRFCMWYGRGFNTV